jgi:hypothetical protein
MRRLAAPELLAQPAGVGVERVRRAQSLEALHVAQELSLGQRIGQLRRAPTTGSTTPASNPSDSADAETTPLRSRDPAYGRWFRPVYGAPVGGLEGVDPGLTNPAPDRFTPLSGRALLVNYRVVSSQREPRKRSIAGGGG